jgi:hypothetical protein
MEEGFGNQVYTTQARLEEEINFGELIGSPRKVMRRLVFLTNMPYKDKHFAAGSQDRLDRKSRTGDERATNQPSETNSK